MGWTKHIQSRKCRSIGSMGSSTLLWAIIGDTLWELLLLKHGPLCAWLPEYVSSNVFAEAGGTLWKLQDKVREKEGFWENFFLYRSNYLNDFLYEIQTRLAFPYDLLCSNTPCSRLYRDADSLLKDESASLQRSPGWERISLNGKTCNLLRTHTTSSENLAVHQSLWSGFRSSPALQK